MLAPSDVLGSFRRRSGSASGAVLSATLQPPQCRCEAIFESRLQEMRSGSGQMRITHIYEPMHDLDVCLEPEPSLRKQAIDRRFRVSTLDGFIDRAAVGGPAFEAGPRDAP